MTKKLSMVAASLLLGATLFTGCSDDDNDSTTSGVTTTEKKAVLSSYADRAYTEYKAAYDDAVLLKTALTTFTTTPTADNLTAAKNAWLQARETYGVTEIYRLSNGPIDGEETFSGSFGAPEGQLNAWPLDEAGIDYTDGAPAPENITGTIVGLNFTSTEASVTIDSVSDITKENLSAINEVGGDANVFSGYHAIEFLLWGQDQDYDDNTISQDDITTGAMTAGERPLTDYTTADGADARKAYLNAAADLIVDDLKMMVDAWDTDTTNTDYRTAFLGSGDNAIDTDVALKQVMAGMGLFIKSELANERMAVAIQTPSEEDEHSCFSDNTHRDIVLNYQGFKNALVETGMLNNADAETKAEMEALITAADGYVNEIDRLAKNEMHFDYQILNDASGEITDERRNAYNAKNALRTIGDKMIDVASDYGIELSNEDVTDYEEETF